MTTTVYCDQCNRVRTDTPIGWLQLTHETTGATLNQDVSDKDFCSYGCLAKYADAIVEQQS